MMDLPTFQSWLAKGLGRAAIFLKEHDSTPYHEVLLNACTHNLTYDVVCEESRTRYLWSLIELSVDQAFFRNGLLLHLTEKLDNPDEYRWEQIFGLARQFAMQGDAEMRQSMYSAFIHLGFERAGLGSAEELVRLDGLEGFVFAVNRFDITAPEDDLHQVEFLLRELGEGLGKDQARELTAQRAREDPKLAMRLSALWEYERRGKEERSQAELQALPDYSTLKAQEADSSWAAHLFTWARTATSEQISDAATDLLTETHPEKLRAYLRIFWRRPLRGDPARLLTLADDEREGIRRAAVIALSNVSHPEVRRRALALLQSPDRLAEGARLLVSNYAPGDFRMLEQSLLQPMDRDTWHGIGSSIRHILKRHLTPDGEESLLLLYENNPCSNCRTDFVRFLIELDKLPEWMRLECRYDAQPETAAAVQ